MKTPLTVNRPLGTTKVKLIIKEAVAAAGLSPEDVAAFSGHSLRVGAAQDLLCAGLDTAAIMLRGRMEIGQCARALLGVCRAQCLDVRLCL